MKNLLLTISFALLSATVGKASCLPNCPVVTPSTGKLFVSATIGRDNLDTVPGAAAGNNHSVSILVSVMNKDGVSVLHLPASYFWVATWSSPNGFGAHNVVSISELGGGFYVLKVNFGTIAGAVWGSGEYSIDVEVNYGPQSSPTAWGVAPVKFTMP
jgi:hypothetical protein